MKRWEKDAEWWLESYAGQLPFSQLCSTFRTVAAKKGWAKRTNRAIEIHGQRIGISFQCDSDNLPAAVLAKRLGIGKNTIYRWIKKGLPARTISYCHKSVKTAELINYLKAHPESAWLANYDGLTSLMDIDTAQEIKDNAIPPKSMCKPVKCIETGQVFNSITDAARNVFVHPRTLSKALQKNRKCVDCHWEYIE